MKGKISVLILLLLLTVTYSQYTPTIPSGDWYDWTNYGNQPVTGTEKNAEVYYYSSQGDIGPFSSKLIKCWVQFNFTSVNTTHSKASRWIMLLYSNGKLVRTTGPRSMPFLGEITYNDVMMSDLLGSFTSLQRYYYFDYSYDNNISSTQLSNICGNDGDLLISWFSGPDDLFFFNVTNIHSITDVLSHYDSSYKGITYMCVNTTNDRLNTNKTNSSVDYVVPININLICEDARDSWTTITQNNNIYIKYSTPKYPFNATTYPDEKEYFQYIQVLSDSGLAANSVASQISDAIYQGGLQLFQEYRKFIFKDMPEPIPTIVKTLNELTNLGVVIISFLLMQKVFMYFLSFRKSIKTSLSKAGMVFSQLMFWFVILVLFFYFMTHMVYLCGMKTAITVYGLGLMGVHFQAPQSITDVPAVAWDLLYVGFVGTSISDCTDYYQLSKDSHGAIISSDFINLENAKISLLLRADVVVMLLFIIMTILAILWETTSYIRRKVKGMEEDIRRPDVDNTDYEDGMD